MMKRIIRDYYVAEARGVLPLLLLIQLLMCGLAYYAGFSYVYMLFIPVLAVVAFLRAVYEGQRFREAFEALPLLRQERIAKEYNAPHSCVQLYLGEAHLLSDCLVCRSRRTLRLFPAETLVQANIQEYSGRNRIVTDLRLVDSSGKVFTLEFWGRQKQALDGFAAHLTAWGVSVR